MTEDRRLSEEEARRLWRRAAELQAEAAHRLEAAADEGSGGGSLDEADRATGYALEDVRAAAREAGIDEACLGRALAELDATAGLVETGVAGGLAERFLGDSADALVVSHLYHALPATVYEALRKVMPRPPYELEVVESRGHPLEGGSLTLEVPVWWTGQQAGDFAYEVRGWADIKEIHLTLRPSGGAGQGCEVTLVCPLARSRRINLWVGGGLTAAGTVAGGMVGLMGLGLLAQAAAGGVALALTVLAVAWVVGAPFGLGYAGMLGYRALYDHTLGRARKALVRLLDAVAVEAGLEGVPGGSAFPPLPPAAPSGALSRGWRDGRAGDRGREGERLERQGPALASPSSSDQQWTRPEERAMADRDDVPPEEERDRPTGEGRAPRTDRGEDREGRGYTDEEQGESRTTNPSAPASSGRTHGDEGTVQPTGGPDLRPAGSGIGPPRESGEETPVPSPSGGASKGSGVRTGSAGAAGAAAGPETDREAPDEDDEG